MDSVIFKYDIPALYAQYVQHMDIANTHVDWDDSLAAFFANGIYTDHYNDVSIDHAVVAPASAGFSAIRLSNGSNSTNKGFQLMQKVNVVE